MKKIAACFVCLVFAISCSTTKKPETDKSVKDFVLLFQTRLAATDNELLELFASKENNEEFLRLANILKDGDSSVKVISHFDEFKLYLEDTNLLIDVPVDI